MQCTRDGSLIESTGTDYLPRTRVVKCHICRILSNSHFGHIGPKPKPKCFIMFFMPLPVLISVPTHQLLSSPKAQVNFAKQIRGKSAPERSSDLVCPAPLMPQDMPSLSYTATDALPCSTKWWTTYSQWYVQCMMSKGPAQLCPTDINLILSLLALRAELAKGDQAPTLDQVFRLPSTSPSLHWFSTFSLDRIFCVYSHAYTTSNYAFKTLAS